MAQTYVIGKIVSDIELKTSAKNNLYIRFELIERIGNGRIQCFHICAFADDAKRFVKANVKKGSFVWVSGSLELELYGKHDGITSDKRMKILLDNWGLIPIGLSAEQTASAEQVYSDMAMPAEEIEIHGDKEPLPM